MINAKEYGNFKLVKLDDRHINNNYTEIRLFMIVRNESLRLPYVMQHYRRLGVDRFFIVDNNSTDTTQDFLLRQSDTHVFFTSESYTGHWQWMESLLENYGNHYWCLVVDADEIFIYPHCEKISLPVLCNYLTKKRQNALHNILVDMYSKTINSNNHEIGSDLIQRSPYFDPFCYSRHYGVWRNGKTGKNFPFYAYFGGTRTRIFGFKEMCCSKISLLKYDEQTYLTQGMHSIKGGRLSDLRGVVLHFKFLYDFIARAQEEARRGEHWQNAAEYKVYVNKIIDGTLDEFYNEHSLKFENTDQLIELKFMKSSPAFRRCVALAGR